MAKKQVQFFVSDMTCVACEGKIQARLKRLSGVYSVQASYGAGEVTVIFDSERIEIKKLIKAITMMGYTISKKEKQNLFLMMGIIFGILALWVLLNRWGLFNLLPVIDSSLTYGAVFVAGLITSFHCAAMCGGINIAQCLSCQGEGTVSAMKPSLFYNAGRVISYTIIGGMIGALGSVLQLSNELRGAITVLAGIFMVLMGLNLINAFPLLKKFSLRLPGKISEKLFEGHGMGSFTVGLLNGLMPCGPLQAMQLYALGTGRPLQGALSMLLFGLGTMPLLFLMGAFSSLLKAKYTKGMMKAGAVMILLLGFQLFGNGMALTGIGKKPSVTTQLENPAVMMGDYQEVSITLSRRGYAPIIVQKGIPVKWTIYAEEGTLTGCNNEIVIPQYRISMPLKEGDTLIEFTPEQSGTYLYTCWMGMIQNSITVVEAPTGL